MCELVLLIDAYEKRFKDKTTTDREKITIIRKIRTLRREQKALEKKNMDMFKIK